MIGRRCNTLTSRMNNCRRAFLRGMEPGFRTRYLSFQTIVYHSNHIPWNEGWLPNAMFTFRHQNWVISILQRVMSACQAFVSIPGDTKHHDSRVSSRSVHVPWIGCCPFQRRMAVTIDLPAPYRPLRPD